MKKKKSRKKKKKKFVNKVAIACAVLHSQGK
jgi:hypothetical protein